ncbi:hypothetical protein TRVL_04999 [Trypanosoma vivax]|nr:hypothetical protein TRVL_04999 [Trypanosoma vivax]
MLPCGSFCDRLPPPSFYRRQALVHIVCTSLGPPRRYLNSFSKPSNALSSSALALSGPFLQNAVLLPFALVVAPTPARLPFQIPCILSPAAGYFFPILLHRAQSARLSPLCSLKLPQNCCASPQAHQSSWNASFAFFRLSPARSQSPSQCVGIAVFHHVRPRLVKRVPSSCSRLSAGRKTQPNAVTPPLFPLPLSPHAFPSPVPPALPKLFSPTSIGLSSSHVPIVCNRLHPPRPFPPLQPLLPAIPATTSLSPPFLCLSLLLPSLLNYHHLFCRFVFCFSFLPLTRFPLPSPRRGNQFASVSGSCACCFRLHHDAVHSASSFRRASSITTYRHKTQPRLFRLDNRRVPPHFNNCMSSQHASRSHVSPLRSLFRRSAFKARSPMPSISAFQTSKQVRPFHSGPLSIPHPDAQGAISPFPSTASLSDFTVCSLTVARCQLLIRFLPCLSLRTFHHCISVSTLFCSKRSQLTSI